ncbi:SCO6880 family protein [Pseudoscardovia radai]|uniref:SCO6880 family protein n=1 Tax=Pseudoscardovia radai TaxID=987066 RepID=UPI003995C832
MATTDQTQRDGTTMPSSTFSPVSNAGVLMNWAPHQVLLGGLALAWMILPLTVGADLLSVRNIPAVIVLLVSLVTIHGRSLWQLAAIHLGFAARKATGQTRWTMSPMARDTTVGYLDLPGSTGKRLKPIELVDTKFGGAAWLWDTTSGEATAILRCNAKPFTFRSAREQAERGTGWSDLMRQAVELPGVTRITTQARCLRVPYPPDKPARSESWSAQQLRDMEDRDMQDTMMHDMILTVTVRQADVEADARRRGGGAVGLGQILKDRVVSLVTLAVKAGAAWDDITWLNCGQIRGLCKTLSSPDAWTLLGKHFELPDHVPLSTSYMEYADRIEADAVCARTLWIDQWPADPVTAGFLQRLVIRPDMQVILTQTWRPKGEHQARKALDNRVAELERIKSRNESMGRNADMRVERELEETRSRLKELADRHVEVDYQGFVTIISNDRQALDRDTRRLRTDMGGTLHFDSMRGQQWAGWVAALPLGQAGR